MRTLCVVLETVAASSLQHLLASESAVDLIAPLRTLDLEDMAAGHADVRFLDFHQLAAEILPAIRDDFVRLIAEWPDRCRIGGKTIKAWLRYQGISRWWLLEPSQRNPESSRAFGVVCLVEIVRLSLERGRYRRVLIVGGDSTETRVVAAVGRRAGCIVEQHLTHSDVGNTLIRLALRRVRAMGGAVMKKVVATRLPCAKSPATHGNRAVAFHTWCPTQWPAQSERPRDRYFVDIPEQVAKSGSEVMYAASLGYVTPKGLRQAIRTVRRLPREITGAMTWIETQVSWGRLVGVFLDVRHWLRFELQWRLDPDLHASFVLPSGVDVFPILLRDLRYALAVQLPVMTLVAAQMRGFVRRRRPTHVVLTMETYCYGRAVIWGTRSAETGARVFGLQHSPAGRNQMFYRFEPSELQGPDPIPLPDQFLLHSAVVVEQLRQAGVSTARLLVTGAPRLAALPKYRKLRETSRAELRRSLGLPDRGRLVLVAGTGWTDETVLLLEYAFRAAVGRDIVLIVKLHPLVASLGEHVDRFKRSYPGVSYVVASRDDLQALLAVVDVVVTGNSTIDVEALAIGCPTIRLSSSVVATSPTEDYPGSVLRVSTVAELQSALDDTRLTAQREHVVERALGPLDDAITDRVVEALLRDSAQPASSVTRAGMSRETGVPPLTGVRAIQR